MNLPLRTRFESRDAIPVRDKSSAELSRDSSYPVTNCRRDGTVAVVVAVPARMYTDRDPLATLLLLESPRWRFPAVADEMFLGGGDRMNLPRFNAEASVYQSVGRYQASGIGGTAEGGVYPARRGFPCSMCADICAGGTGICDRWCACACRGGTHCPPPD
jgi:hypothetical protein